MDTTNDTRGHLRLAASGGEVVLDGPLFPVEPVPLNALERALACAGGRIERSPGRPEVGRDEVRGSENWWWPVRTLPLQL